MEEIKFRHTLPVQIRFNDVDKFGHVNRQVLYDEYKASHPNGYGKSQFYYHLKQNLVAQKDVIAVLANTYHPGEKLMVDFAGDKLSYVDTETGEIVKVEVFVACLPYSDYTYVICVPSQKTEHFLYAIRMKRNIYNKLLEWKNDDYRKPLMLEGARQVGKTFILKQFGTSEFKNMKCQKGINLFL